MADRGKRINFGIALRLALVLATLLIGVSSWIFGRTIGYTKILDSRHTILITEFEDFERALQNQVVSLCATKSIRTVYFDHWDIALIGILDTTGRDTQCRVVRETPVTQVAANAIAQCSAVLVKERHLSWNSPGVTEWELGSIGPQVSRIARWNSFAGHFGFDVYRKTGCDPLARGPADAEGSQGPRASL